MGFNTTGSSETLDEDDGDIVDSVYESASRVSVPGDHRDVDTEGGIVVSGQLIHLFHLPAYRVASADLGNRIEKAEIH